MILFCSWIRYFNIKCIAFELYLEKVNLCAWWLRNHWKHYLEAQFILQLVMFWHFFLILIFLGIELFSAQRAKFSPEEKTKCLRIDWLQMGKHQFLKTTILPSPSQCLFYVQLYIWIRNTELVSKRKNINTKIAPQDSE